MLISNSNRQSLSSSLNHPVTSLSSTLFSLKEKVNRVYMYIFSKIQSIWTGSNNTEWETRSLTQRNITIETIPEEENPELDIFWESIDF
jgi:hypothetical protein